MRKFIYSATLATLLIALLAVTVYSQRTTSDDEPAVQLLQGGVSHQLPVDVTLVIATESGPQTVTVPIMLNLNLSIGPVGAVDLAVDAAQASQAVSPLRVVEPLTATIELTDTEEVTGTGTVTE